MPEDQNANTNGQPVSDNFGGMAPQAGAPIQPPKRTIEPITMQSLPTNEVQVGAPSVAPAPVETIGFGDPASDVLMSNNSVASQPVQVAVSADPVSSGSSYAVPQSSDFNPEPAPVVEPPVIGNQQNTPDMAMNPVAAPVAQAPVPGIVSSEFSAGVPQGPSFPDQQPSGNFSATPTGASSGSSKKKKIIIGAVVAVTLAVIGGVSTFAYTSYQNPERVVVDSLVNLLGTQPKSGDGVLTFHNDDGSLTAKVAMRSNDDVVNGNLSVAFKTKEYNLDLSGSADFAAEKNGNGYVRLNKIDTLLSDVVDVVVDAQVNSYKSYGTEYTPDQVAALKQQMMTQFEPFIAKINNKWIKFEADKKDDKASKEQKCLSDTLKKLQSDSGVRSEVADAYKENRFILIKDQLGVKDGSYGYVIDFDENKSNSFGKAVEVTSVIKEYKKCTGDKSESSFDDSNISDESKKDDTDMRIEVWVSQWSHQLTKVNVTSTIANEDGSGKNESKIKFTSSFDYSPAKDVTVPKDTVDSKELQADISNLLYGGGASTSATLGAGSI